MQRQEKTMNNTPLIIENLDILRKKEIANSEPFRARAYAKAISQLNGMVITRFEDVQGVAGIGEKIRDKIKEILETGLLQSAEKVKEDGQFSALNAFQNIYGVGPVKARELVKAGFKSIAELRDTLAKPSLSDTLAKPSLSDTLAKPSLNDKQLIGLKYYEELLERIPRHEMEIHREVLIDVYGIKSYETEIVGSFRRGATTSGDIDVLIRVPPKISAATATTAFKKYVFTLVETGYILEILAMGPHKCMAICQLNGGKARRLDLLLTPDKEYAFALLYFTGSDRFNVAFRQHAVNRGFSLNEKGLTPLSGVTCITPIPYMKDEVAIFEFLGLEYVEPQQRSSAVVQLKF
jgi:DNA polymerase/3'-5' exonuclease PolX